MRDCGGPSHATHAHRLDPVAGDAPTGGGVTHQSVALMTGRRVSVSRGDFAMSGRLVLSRSGARCRDRTAGWEGPSVGGLNLPEFY
jgi:hypothetical protein